MVYLKSVENVITLGKLIGLLFLFCLPLLSILFLKTKRNDLARPVMGTIFLVIWRASEASETPSVDTYPIEKKCLDVNTSKPQCACSQFYVKRRSGRACICEKLASKRSLHLRLLAVRGRNYEKLCLRASKRQSACTSKNFTFARPLMVTIY